MSEGVKGPTRRELVIAAASIGLSAATTWRLLRPQGPGPERAGAAPPDAGSTEPPAHAKLHALTAVEYAALVAASECVFPRDESPGATDLGVAAYVDAALGKDDAPAWSDDLRSGLARLDSEADKQFAVPFHRARPADRDAMIGAWAANAEPGRSRFVRQLIAATLEGALGDPTYGGNAGGGGWKAFGFLPDDFSPSAARP